MHADVDPERLIEIIGGATLLRLLLAPGRELDESWVDQTTAIVVHGVARGDPVIAHRSRYALPMRSEFTRRGFLGYAGASGLLIAAGRSAAPSAFAISGPVTVNYAFGQTVIPAPPKRVVSAGFTEHDDLLAWAWCPSPRPGGTEPHPSPSGHGRSQGSEAPSPFFSTWTTGSRSTG